MTEFERAIIIANSNQSVRSDLTSIISSKDLLIAADGGGKHCLDAGCTPQIIIGDLDFAVCTQRIDRTWDRSINLSHPEK